MTDEEIAKLPTLLDTLEWYLQGRQFFEIRDETSIFKGAFATHYQEGKFEAILMEDGTSILQPCCTEWYTYYRGESEYHSDCRPSLYRTKMTDLDVFFERLKRCELELLLKQYPITSIYAHGLQFKDPAGCWHPFFFRINPDALAQHYGIKTEWMDLTVDLWTAAFFAATVNEKGKYRPATTEDSKYGCFYQLSRIDMVLPGQRHDSRIETVGLQPLARPGRQAGYVYKMYPNDDFNKQSGVGATLFRQDDRINEFIFNYTNRGNRLFPQEIIGKKIQNGIVNGKRFSKNALQMTKDRYCDFLLNKVDDYVRDLEIEITDDIIWFTDREKEEIIDNWNKQQDEFFKQILVRWTYFPKENDVKGK